MWSRIGVKTSVEALAPSVFFKKRDSYSFSAYMAGWSATNGKMSNPLTSLLMTRNPDAGDSTTNRGRYSNPERDKLVRTASRAPDEGKRPQPLPTTHQPAAEQHKD